MKENKKVISAKVTLDTFAEIEKTAEDLNIDKNELINRSVRLFIACHHHAITLTTTGRRTT